MEFKLAGRRAYVYTAGHAIDPSKPTIVFVHGAGNDHSTWTQQSRYFAYHGRNVLAVDLPGHGRSEGPTLPAVPEMADWIAALLDAAGIGRASLAGHSMGSLASLNFAARHPARAEKIALVGTCVPMPVSNLLLDAARDEPARAYDMVNIWSHAPQSQLGGNAVPGLWMMGYALRLAERNTKDALYRDLKSVNEYGTGFDDAQKIRCPALLILGRRDLMTPAKNAKELAAKIPGARTVIVGNAGHSLMSEAPWRVLDELIAFL